MCISGTLPGTCITCELCVIDSNNGRIVRGNDVISKSRKTEILSDRSTSRRKGGPCDKDTDDKIVIVQ